MNVSFTNLNRAIHDWRAGLSKGPALQRDSLDELESHLRDSIATLTEKGLSEEEAFLIAVRRCGTPRQLQTEFSKYGVKESLVEVWFFRTAWIVAGSLALINGDCLWHRGAVVRGVILDEHSLGLGPELVLPKLMLVMLAVTGLNIWQLRNLSRARIHHARLSPVYWSGILVILGTLILASRTTFDIVCGRPLLLALFSVTQILILALLTAISGICAFVRKIRRTESRAIASWRKFAA